MKTGLVIIIIVLVSLVTGNPYLMYGSPWSYGNSGSSMYGGLYGMSPWFGQSRDFPGFLGGGGNYQGLFGRRRSWDNDDYENYYPRMNRGIFGRNNWNDFDR
ncbi:uncharacterized protein LOC144619339 [Crassostrea virginica]